MDQSEQLLYVRALLHVRTGALEEAYTDAVALRPGQVRTTPGFEAQRHLVRGLVLTLQGSPLALEAIRVGTGIARNQGARLWVEYGSLLSVLADSYRDVSQAVVATQQEMPVVLSMLAEPLMLRMHELTPEARRSIYTEAAARPWRWRDPARRQLRSRATAETDAAAELLEVVGDASDVQLLHEVGRLLKRSAVTRLGSALARRLADRVFVDDLGRVRIQVGHRTIEPSEVRRRVLALLCLLLSRPGFASTREEVIDNLWPDHDPGSALNSLNQTAYFLRRVFEPNYREDRSPGYLGQDGETIWLDDALVDCRSRRCLEIIRSMPGDPTPEGSVALASEYDGIFALDFAYEEWSAPYRDALHAAYLRVTERAIRMDLDAGQVARGTFLAERALEVAPDAEEIQVSLIRLYRLSGAHAAAEETYRRYERAMKNLGLEPIAFADL